MSKMQSQSHDPQGQMTKTAAAATVIWGEAKSIIFLIRENNGANEIK